MTYQPYPQPPVQQPTSRRIPVWVFVAGGLAAVVLFGIIAGLTFVLAGGKSSGSTPAAAPSTESTVLVAGTLDLMDAYSDGTGTACSGSGGYSDIADGAQVVVTDASGKTIGVGSLVSGVSTDLVGNIGTCEFTFAVRVPSGVGPYAVEVTHRGKISFTEADAGDVKLTLGS